MKSLSAILFFLFFFSCSLQTTYEVPRRELAGNEVAETLVNQHSETLSRILRVANFQQTDHAALNRLAYTYYFARLFPDIPIEEAPEDLASVRIPANKIPEVKVNGVTITPPSFFDELVPFMDRVHEQILAGQDQFELEVNGEKIIAKLPPLGQGNQGIAYRTLDNKVIKLPRNHLTAMASILLEDAPSQFWYEHSTNASFAATQRFRTNQLGIFAISELDQGEPMVHLFFKAGMLKVEDGEVKIAPQSEWKIAASEIQKITAAVGDLVSIMNETPQMSLSISPNNLHITYADADEKIIDKVTLLDFGPFLERLFKREKITREVVDVMIPNLATQIRELEEEIGRQLTTDELLEKVGFQDFEIEGEKFTLFSEYNQVKELNDYLKISQKKITKYLARGYVSPELMPYADAFRAQNADRVARLDGVSEALRPDFVRDGDLIGISTRKGGTPFVVQSTTESPIDHVGMIIKDDQGVPRVYQFTNAFGVHSLSLQDFIESNRSPDGRVHFAFGRPRKEYSREQYRVLKDTLDAYSEEDFTKIDDPKFSKLGDLRRPSSCSQLVEAAFRILGEKVAKPKPVEWFRTSNFGGWLDEAWRKVLPSHENLIPPRSFFESEHVRLMSTNLPGENPLNWTMDQMHQTWSETGDLSKIARFFTFIKYRTDRAVQRLSPEEKAALLASDMARWLELSKQSCLSAADDIIAN